MNRNKRIAVLVVALVAAGTAWAVGAVSSPVALDIASPANVTTTAALPPPTSQSATATVATTTTTTQAPTPVGVPEAPGPEPGLPTPGVVGDFDGLGIATVPGGGADLFDAAGGAPLLHAREGLVFPVEAAAGDWVRILTPCESAAWLQAGDVLIEAKAPPVAVGAGFALSSAVIVIDPGHGGPHNLGATSPDGALLEKDVNLDIARRVRDLLTEPHDVDWTAGTIFVGNEVPGAGRVIVTRTGDGDAADYEAGLRFRAKIANAAGAHALISIHNNAGFETTLKMAGSDVYYQSQLVESRRLAVLLVEEFERSFVFFDTGWVGAIEVGAKSRLSPRDGTTQYYGVLRHTEVPAVIAEGAYLTSEGEAALLATTAFRQAYAEAVYRAVVRFLTTDDPGDGPSYDPEVWDGSAGSGAPKPDCVVPSQPS